jgi:hypothetical protein
MGGNTASESAAIQYSIRLTFGIVHAALLTVFSFCLALVFPSLSHFLFGLFGFCVAPLLSFCLALFCNCCIEYVSESTITLKHSLATAWIPPLGVFCASLVILPLEMMPSLGFHGPITTLAATSIALNFLVTALLQVYAGKEVQTQLASYSSKSEESLSAAEAAGGSPPT